MEGSLRSMGLWSGERNVMAKMRINHRSLVSVVSNVSSRSFVHLRAF